MMYFLVQIYQSDSQEKINLFIPSYRWENCTPKPTWGSVFCTVN